MFFYRCLLHSWEMLGWEVGGDFADAFSVEKLTQVAIIDEKPLT